MIEFIISLIIIVTIICTTTSVMAMNPLAPFSPYQVLTFMFYSDLVLVFILFILCHIQVYWSW